MFSPTQGVSSSNLEWNGYQAPVYPTPIRSLPTLPAFLNTRADALTSNDLPSSSRCLLSEESAEVGGDGFPSWVADRQRKLLQATTATVKPNVVVAKDGSGKYKTISAASAEVPKKSNETFVIYIKAGVYVETVNVSKHIRNVFLIGDGPTKTKITGSKSFVGGVNTYRTATVCKYHIILI
ncbi:hypothetical protein ACSBR2_036451 [Camellia fascicularis]